MQLLQEDTEHRYGGVLVQVTDNSYVTKRRKKILDQTLT